jgi:hypothetical protein
LTPTVIRSRHLQTYLQLMPPLSPAHNQSDGWCDKIIAHAKAKRMKEANLDEDDDGEAGSPPLDREQRLRSS